MPWVLIAIGVLVMAFAAAIRESRHVDPVVRVEALPAQTTTTGTSGGRSSAVDENGLHLQKRTTTEKPPSDTLLGVLVGAGAVLVVLGAFYTRVSKLTVAGNTVELTSAAPPSPPQDAKALAEAVTERLRAGMEERGEISGDEITADQAARLAAQAAVAAARAQQIAASLRAAGVAAATLPPEAAAAEPVTVDAAQLQALGAGLPLPEDLLARLADRAVEETLDE